MFQTQNKPLYCGNFAKLFVSGYNLARTKPQFQFIFDSLNEPFTISVHFYFNSIHLFMSCDRVVPLHLILSKHCTIFPGSLIVMIQWSKNKQPINSYFCVFYLIDKFMLFTTVFLQSNSQSSIWHSHIYNEIKTLIRMVMNKWTYEYWSLIVL